MILCISELHCTYPLHSPLSLAFNKGPFPSLACLVLVTSHHISAARTVTHKVRYCHCTLLSRLCYQTRAITHCIVLYSHPLLFLLHNLTRSLSSVLPSLIPQAQAQARHAAGLIPCPVPPQRIAGLVCPFFHLTLRLQTQLTPNSLLIQSCLTTNISLAEPNCIYGYI